MVKIGKFLFVLMAITCLYCCKDEEAKLDFSIRINPFVSIKWNDRIAITELGNIRKTDTLRLSSGDMKFIEESYFENKIYNFSGVREFYEDLPLMPPSNLEISFIVGGKKQANILISDRLTNSNDLKTRSVIRFRNDLVRTLDNNEDYKKVMYSFNELMKLNMQKGLRN